MILDMLFKHMRGDTCQLHRTNDGTLIMLGDLGPHIYGLDQWAKPSLKSQKKKKIVRVAWEC